MYNIVFSKSQNIDILCFYLRNVSHKTLILHRRMVFFHKKV